MTLTFTSNPMIEIYFLMPDGARNLIATFVNDEMYMICHRSLEAQAHEMNATLDETFITPPTVDSYLPKWDGVHKILHQGYVYARYADLTPIKHGDTN